MRGSRKLKLKLYYTGFSPIDCTGPAKTVTVCMSSGGTQSPRLVDLIDGDFGSCLDSASPSAASAGAAGASSPSWPCGISEVSAGVGAGADDFEAVAAAGGIPASSTPSLKSV